MGHSFPSPVMACDQCSSARNKMAVRPLCDPPGCVVPSKYANVFQELKREDRKSKAKGKVSLHLLRAQDFPGS